MSSVGYALSPMLIVGFVGIFVNLQGGIGIFLSLSVAMWSSISGGKIMIALLK
jgi:hypothetical protein